MKSLVFALSLLAILGCSTSCSKNQILSSDSDDVLNDETRNEGDDEKLNEPTLNDDYYRGFSMDNVLQDEELGLIHYNVYVPESYDGTKPYALYFTLPGYQGLYRFGVGSNLETEDFAFEAMNYVSDMIIVAPQLNDWGVTSSNQTISLVHYFLGNYNIDRNRVYANGYSGGGETMSGAMGIEPSLFGAYLHCSSIWDGDLNVLVDSETPVYIVIGENDEYYGSEPSIETYNQIVSLYERKGLSQDRINELVVLDVKNSEYFTSQGMNNQHGGGGYLFSRDSEIMGWLFSH